ncbi:MAG: cupin domain-containing protein [Gammaproteobacteria bacterium]
MQNSLKLAISIGSIAVAIVAVQVAVGQQTPPTESKGVSGKVIGVLKLTDEIPGMGGRELRLRVTTVEPGGVFALHNHKDRPAVEFILSGSATEFRGTTSKVHKDGDAAVTGKDVTHWWRNDGKVPTVFVVADIFNPSK